MARSTNSTSKLGAEQRHTIKELVCDILELEPDEVTSTSLFKEDHDADSLSAIEILSVLERTFHLTIDQAEMSRMVNLDGVCAVVEEAAAN
ncbi:acyl carrier protein [Amycolatopsis samaneae]|uniref:Acyl carrier protein n=1 Tax=Amycolatopsis samaneae TaxID=664691 RepID=A0ABW5GP31_9PSEU